MPSPLPPPPPPVRDVLADFRRFLSNVEPAQSRRVAATRKLNIIVKNEAAPGAEGREGKRGREDKSISRRNYVVRGDIITAGLRPGGGEGTFVREINFRE